ncbi:MAG TPA: hypothetical protein PLK99_11650, partial [Burkholderiales bacterium]|nr:hypothetical protein [Burkholderiales bacterium]
MIDPEKLPIRLGIAIVLIVLAVGAVSLIGHSSKPDSIPAAPKPQVSARKPAAPKPPAPASMPKAVAVSAPAPVGTPPAPVETPPPPSVSTVAPVAKRAHEKPKSVK